MNDFIFPAVWVTASTLYDTMAQTEDDSVLRYTFDFWKKNCNILKFPVESKNADVSYKELFVFFSQRKIWDT